VLGVQVYSTSTRRHACVIIIVVPAPAACTAAASPTGPSSVGLPARQQCSIQPTLQATSPGRGLRHRSVNRPVAATNPSSPASLSSSGPPAAFPASVAMVTTQPSSWKRGNVAVAKELIWVADRNDCCRRSSDYSAIFYVRPAPLTSHK